MSCFLLKKDNITYSKVDYGSINNIRRPVLINNIKSNDYISVGNLTLPNQHPLVKFMVMFSINPEWEFEYLVNYITANVDNYSSQLGFTSIYNKGKSFTNILFPEDKHHTLITIPFDFKPNSIESYLDNRIEDLVPFYTIYSTDTKQRLDIKAIINSEKASYQNKINTYTIVQVDYYALLIGYWRYLKERDLADRNLGLSPHAYLMNFPIVNFYRYHSEYININYLHDFNIEVDNPIWDAVNIKDELEKYIVNRAGVFQTRRLKSINHLFYNMELVNPFVNKDKMLFPNIGSSASYTQMSWIYNFHSLHMANIYMEYQEQVGYRDDSFVSLLEKFFRFPLQTIINNIKDPNWKNHFNTIYKDAELKLKNLKP